MTRNNLNFLKKTKGLNQNTTGVCDENRLFSAAHSRSPIGGVKVTDGWTQATDVVV